MFTTIGSGRLKKMSSGGDESTTTGEEESEGEWVDDDPAPKGMDSSSALRPSQMRRSGARHVSESSETSETGRARRTGYFKPKRPVVQVPSRLAMAEKRQPVASGRAEIKIALSGSKLVFADGVWQDATDKEELLRTVHPLIGENMSLKQRAELLVKMIAQTEYHNMQVSSEIKECDELIREMKAMLGDPMDEPEEDPQMSESESR
jgi:hypothetical protein